MTQQDETGQRAATQESAPSLPSPYLEASEAAPQTYLAPPQPDQPKYGTQPPSYRTRPSADGSGSQPDTSQGVGRQPGYGQPSYVPAGDRRRGARLRRDASIAAPWERLAAAIVDWIIIAGVSVLAFWSPVVRVWRQWEAVTNSYRDQGSPAAQAAINNMFRDPANQHALLFWFLGMFGIALAYYWLQHAAWGATIGKRMVGVRVVLAADQARIGVQTAGIRAVAFLAGPAAFLLSPSPINVAGGLFWVADTGLMLLDPRAQSLHDKLAGTLVMKKRWLDQQALSADR